MGYGEPQRFSDVQQSVMEDTFQLLGINPDDPEAFKVNEPFLAHLTAYFGAAPEEREGMEPPSIAGVFTTGQPTDGPSGLEGSWLATMDALGHQMGENPEVMAWADQAKMEIAQQYTDPMLKNRSANLFVQGARGGNSRRQREALEQDPMAGATQAPPSPTPGPTPPQPGTHEYEIWLAEQRQENPLGGIQ